MNPTPIPAYAASVPLIPFYKPVYSDKASFSHKKNSKLYAHPMSDRSKLDESLQKPQSTIMRPFLDVQNSLNLKVGYSKQPIRPGLPTPTSTKPKILVRQFE